jgi:hypothetical protein
MEQSIEKHIARRTFYSIPLFFVTSLVAYRYNYQRLTALLWIQTYTSFIFWNSPKKGLYMEKMIDMFTASITIITTITIECYFFTDFCRYFFWIMVAISISGFVLNDHWFHFHINMLDEMTRKHTVKYVSFVDEKTIKLDIIYLKEMVQTKRVYIHMFLLHILPNIVCMYCIKIFIYNKVNIPLFLETIPLYMQ